MALVLAFLVYIGTMIGNDQFNGSEAEVETTETSDSVFSD